MDGAAPLKRVDDCGQDSEWPDHDAVWDWTLTGFFAARYGDATAGRVRRIGAGVPSGVVIGLRRIRQVRWHWATVAFLCFIALVAGVWTKKSNDREAGDE